MLKKLATISAPPTQIIAAVLVSLAFMGHALAQQPEQNSADQYWQQLLANKEAQSSQQIVNLARQLDAANAKIVRLTKELQNAKQQPKASSNNGSGGTQP